MRTRADILHLLIEDLQMFDATVAALIRENEIRIRATRSHLYDSEAQIVSRSKDPARPRRQNGSFLQRLPRQRAN